ncbi:MAG TPA: RHS repeat domain-containing protein [Chryseolinea sp.]
MLLIVFVTCSKDNDPVKQQPSGGKGQPSGTCVLKSATWTGLSITIDRDDQHLPVSIRYTTANKPVVICSIQYDADHRIVKLIQGNAYVEYAYQAGKPVMSTIFIRQSSSDAFEQRWQYYYHYDDQGRLDSTTDDTGQYDRYEYDAAGNVIKHYTKQTGQIEVLAQQYVTFDDKKNPLVEASFDQVPMLDASVEEHFITMLKLPMISQHNVTKYVYVSSSGVISLTYTYQYNSEGYPISTRTQSDAQPGVTDVIAYDCF